MGATVVATVVAASTTDVAFIAAITTATANDAVGAVVSVYSVVVVSVYSVVVVCVYSVGVVIIIVAIDVKVQSIIMSLLQLLLLLLSILW